MKARVNRSSLQGKQKMLQEKAEAKVKEELREIAEYATAFSPVDTGAFVTSWSLKNSYSSGRAVSSRGKPRNQNIEAKQQEGLGQLSADINALSIFDTPSVSGSLLFVLSNGAPHADAVDERYDIMRRLRNRYG